MHQDIVAEQPGSDLPEGISAAVSSPGAERQIVIPDDLQRFGEVPLKVAFKNKSKPQHFEWEGTITSVGDSERLYLLLCGQVVQTKHRSLDMMVLGLARIVKRSSTHGALPMSKQIVSSLPFSCQEN